MKAVKPPSWFARGVHRFVRWIFPEIAMTRQESLQAIKNLNSRLQAEREETKYWRDRALKVEQAFAYSIKSAHDESRKCEGVSWRTLF